MSGNSRVRFFASVAIVATAAVFSDATGATGAKPLCHEDKDRVFSEFPLEIRTERPSALVVEFPDASAMPPCDPALFRAASVHLRSGGGWRSASLPLSALRESTRIPISSLSPEGNPGPVERSDILRISIWRVAPLGDDLSGKPGTAPFLAKATLVGPAEIAILAPTDETAPGETGFAAAMSERAARLARRAEVSFDIVSDTVLRSASDAAETLKPYRAAVLPFNPGLSRGHVSALRAFVDNGGRVVAFYNSSAQLAALLGFGAPHWEHSECSGILPRGGEIGGAFPHPTDNLMCPVVRASSRGAGILATWADSSGRDSGKTAVASTPAGAAFAHIPPLAFRPAANLFRQALGMDFLPAETNAAKAATDAFVATNRLLYAWAPHGATPEFLRRMIRRTPEVRTLHLRPEQRFSPKPDGLRFSLYFPVLFDPSGKGTWLDPRDAAVRRGIVARAVRELNVMRRASDSSGATNFDDLPQSVQLDYVRCGETADPETTAAVTALVGELSAALRAKCPDVEIGAAVFPTPAAAAARNQDWPTWVSNGFVDLVHPMIYDENPEGFAASLAACAERAPAGKIVPAIANGADEAQLSPSAFAAELAAAMRLGCPSVAFFPLDESLPPLLKAVR